MKPPEKPEARSVVVYQCSHCGCERLSGAAGSEDAAILASMLASRTVHPCDPANGEFGIMQAIGVRRAPATHAPSTTTETKFEVQQ